MSPYESLQQQADDDGIVVIDCPLPDGRQAIYIRAQQTPVLAVEKALEPSEAACACAEALGHHYTGGANTLALSPRDAGRQRYRARGWAYRRLLPLPSIAEAYLEHDANPHAMAEALCVSAPFLECAIGYYREQYGPLARLPPYQFQFIPWFEVTKIT